LISVEAKSFSELPPLVDAEALRLVKNLGRWPAGHHEGTPANIAFTLLITFKLQ